MSDRGLGIVLAAVLVLLLVSIWSATRMPRDIAPVRLSRRLRRTGSAGRPRNGMAAGLRCWIFSIPGIGDWLFKKSAGLK